MKCFLQLLYDIAVKECELPFDIIGFKDTRTELRKLKGKPLYQKPILWFGDNPQLVTGLQQAPGNRLYFSDPDNMYAIPVESESLATKKNRIAVDCESVINKPYIRKNGDYVLIGSDEYELTYYNMLFFEKLLKLSVRQYKHRRHLVYDGKVISTMYT